MLEIYTFTRQKKEVTPMLGIGRIYNAALSATHDRYFITKASRKKKLSTIDQNLKAYVEQTSGPSTNNVIEAAKRWGKAYKTGVQRIKKTERIENQFKTPSIISEIVSFIASAIKK